MTAGIHATRVVQPPQKGRTRDAVGARAVCFMWIVGGRGRDCQLPSSPLSPSLCILSLPLSFSSIHSSLFARCRPSKDTRPRRRPPPRLPQPIQAYGAIILSPPPLATPGQPPRSPSRMSRTRRPSSTGMTTRSLTRTGSAVLVLSAKNRHFTGRRPFRPDTTEVRLFLATVPLVSMLKLDLEQHSVGKPTGKLLMHRAP